MRRWGRYSGEMLMATGALHSAAGVALFREQLARIGRSRFVDAVEARRGRKAEFVERELAFWFLMTGAGLLTTGQLASWAQRRTGTLPPALGWSLLGTSVAGAALMPRSGFWLLIPQALLILGRSHEDARDL